MTVQIRNAELARLLGVYSRTTQPALETIINMVTYEAVGLVVQTYPGNFVGRTLRAGPTYMLYVTYGDGIYGDPTVDISDAELLAIGNLVSAANQLPYFTGPGTAALTTLSSFIRTLLDDADAATARATLGVDASGTGQPLDAFLTSIAALGTAADRLIYTTGVDTAAETPVTSFIRTLLDDANASAARTTLGLVIGTDVQAFDAELAAIAGLTSAADRLPYFTGSGTAALATFTAFARTLVDDAVATAARSTLGLVIGTNVQAWDADLDALAALAATAGMLSRTGAGAFAVRTLTAPAAGITISNGTGAAGNPTWALANDLAALEGLASTGLAARTTTDTWAQRTITGTTDRVTVTNGDGVSGNPTIDVSHTIVSPSGPFLMLPQLRGFWPMSAVGANGYAIDISGNMQHLKYNGNPNYVIDTNLIAYLDFDGTGDYLSRTNEATLDITNANAFTTNDSLMVGGWFYCNNNSNQYTLIGKDDLSSQRGFRLYRTTTPGIGISIGSSNTLATAGTTNATWFFAALVVSGTSAQFYLNGSFSGSIGSLTIPSVTAPFTIGGSGAGTELLQGRAALCFLGAARYDNLLDHIYNKTKGWFGL